MSSDSEDILEPADDAARTISRGTRMVAVLVAVLLGGLAAGGVLWFRGGFDDADGLGGSAIGEGNYEANDFTRSQPGDCLEWSADGAGQPTKVPCTEKHRFEVAGALDTSDFPGTEFAKNAQWPGPDRFAEIRDEQCESVVNRYLGGGLDPQGRFAVGMMFPSQAQWERGARVLRCGIEQPGTKGVQDEFTGRAADTDQSFAWPVGTCIGIDPQTRKPTTEPVNCAEPHAFQTTGVIDLSQRFGNRGSGKPWPSVDDQNVYLKTICPTQTNQFFKGPDKFKKTTLNVQWSVISEVSWMTGSRRVVCYVALPDRGGFARLVGDARQQLLINGKLPVPPAEGPPGRALPTPVPEPEGYVPNPQEVPAPAG
ncbi:MAG: septum formation family protein [Gordonia sp. (in: high G+C Gram-positive bacteria)]|uniref:septum formation family protein n=1 Tax=Gordonia sp. (in: high G+C Gram-positive bacteria) TaxID=84139 RepID=UPI0039E69222